MTFTEKIIVGSLLVGWLVPVRLAWPQLRVNPFWAWARIVAALWMFLVLELMVWLPRARKLSWWLCAGVGIYIARSFIKRSRTTGGSNRT